MRKGIIFAAGLMWTGSVLAQGVPGAYTGNGSLSVTTTPALVNTMTVNSTGKPLPANLNNVTVSNPGGGTVAVCPSAGSASCTCSQNGVANTNGLTIGGGLGAWSYVLQGVASNLPKIVACSVTTVVEFQW